MKKRGEVAEMVVVGEKGASEMRGSGGWHRKVAKKVMSNKQKGIQTEYRRLQGYKVACLRR